MDAQVPPAGAQVDDFGFEACFNFRDLGGWPSRYGAVVARGKLFRSDSLHRMTPHDVARLRDLGLRTVLDLRTEDERARAGGLRNAPADLVVHHVPMVDRAAAIAPREVVPPLAERAERYLRMTRESAGGIASAVSALADSTHLPAIFHCAAGRDRTGVFAALVLMVLGVGDAEIVADYALTQRSKAATDTWVARHEPATQQMWSHYPADLRTTYPETMELFLDRFRAESGSAEEYLAAAGVPSAVPADLRFLLLE